jgi:hypothetical protein
VARWLDYVEKNKIEPIHLFDEYRDNRTFWLEVAKQYGNALYAMPSEMADASDPMNTELILAAVKQDGMALRFVKKATLEICEAAVKQNNMAIKYVPPHLRDQVQKPYRDGANYKVSGFATRPSEFASTLPAELKRTPDNGRPGSLISQYLGLGGKSRKRRKLRKRTKRKRF